MITVVLARPEIPANVGFIARGMANHGLSDLRIVQSPGIAAHPEAVRTSSGEEAILAGSRDFADLETALRDCAFALAFSRRARDPGQRVLALPEAVPQFRSFAATGPDSGRLALVFGCESQGLSREETFRCSHVVRIPLPGPLLSLNLSHAVAIALYAFHGGAPGNEDMGLDITEAIQEGAARHQPRGPGGAFPGTTGPKPLDPAEEVLPLAESERIFTAVLARLAERGAFRPAKAEAQQAYLRVLWQRLQPTRREAEFLTGLLKKLASP